MMSWITTFTTLLFVACLYVTSGSVVYVSPLGDDTRNGTLGFPVLTFSAAMGLTSLSERSAIYFDTGAYYNMNIELVNLGNISLTLSAGNGTTKPVFYKHDTMYLNKISGQYNTLLIYNTSGVTIDGIIFQVKDDKYIIGLGSLLYINSSNNVLIQNCELLGNLATTGSGAYIVHSKNITMINNLIANNEAVRRDSALESIFLNSVGSHFNMTSGFMSGNIPFFISQKDILTVGIGGGMYTVESSITVLATIFRNNSATFGGALVLSTNSAFTTRGCLFDSNVAIKQGSVIYSNDIDLEHSVDLTNCMFVNNICRIWSCKLIYAEIWQNQYNKKIADFSPYFTLVVDIIILCLVGLILLSGAAQFLCIFTKYRLAKKKNGRVTPVSTNGNSTEQLGATPTTPVIDTPLGKTDPLVKTEKEVPAIVGTPQDDTSKPTVSLDPKPTPDAPKKEISDEDVSSEEEEEQQEEDIPAGNSAILNTISTAVDTAADWITTGYITPVLDSGLLSIYFQWLFSLSGLTYPIQINKVWRAGHSLFFGFVLTLTALKAFTTSFGIPSFFYDVFDYINIGFGAAECLLLYLMPVTCYFTLMIASNIMKSVIFRERQKMQFALIVIGTSILLFLAFIISVVASTLSLDFFVEYTAIQVVSNLVYVIYWAFTGMIICFMIVITVIFVAFINARISEFFGSIEALTAKGQFNYEESILNYSRLKQYLTNVSLKTNWYLGPILGHLGFTIVLEIIMEIWGIEGFYTGALQNVRYAIIVCFAVMALFLFLSYGLVTQLSLRSKARLLDLIIKIGNESQMRKYVRMDSEGSTKTDKKKMQGNSAGDTIRQLHQFNEFLSSNTFVYSLFGIIPLYIPTIIQYATILISLFAAARTLQSTLSSSLYSS